MDWCYEGVGWRSYATNGVPLYRKYNPYAQTGTHNYTTRLTENDDLVSVGWRVEGGGRLRGVCREDRGLSSTGPCKLMRKT